MLAYHWSKYGSIVGYKMDIIQQYACLVINLILVYIIATNQRVVAAKRQQRGLVAVTIRGSVLFYSSAI